MFFATLAVAATAVLSWVSYRGVAAALEADYVRRTESLAVTIASQVSPEDITDVHQFGEDGHGYAALQVLLEEMRAASQVWNATVIDSARNVLYDCRDADLFHSRSALDSLAGPAITAALDGHAAISPEYVRRDQLLRAGVATIPASEGRRRAAGAVIVEAPISYDDVLDGLERDFVLRTLIAALAMAVLAVILIRIAWSSQELERRLSRSENLAAMGRMTATLAHEIKNPLAIIRGSAERLGKLDPEAKRMADYVVEESDRLSHTVARYLQFARGDESRGDGDAIAALDATLALLEGELRARRVTLARERTAEGAPVRLDNESLKQVYLNLVLNALDAMSEGGTLAVADAERGGGIEVRIADTGTGIPPDVLKKLGNPFFTTRAQGTGLGLFLAKRLLESAGGSLGIESEPGKGTVCTVRLPRHGGRSGDGTKV